MATYSDIAQKLNFQESVYRGLVVRLAEIKQKVDNGAGAQEILGEYARLRNSISVAKGGTANVIRDIKTIQGATTNEIQGLELLGNELLRSITALETELGVVLRQARENDRQRRVDNNPPASSAGEEAQEEKKANTEGSKTQNPPLPTIKTTPGPSNANKTPTIDDNTLEENGGSSQESVPTTPRTSRQTQSGEATTNDDNPETNTDTNTGVSTQVGNEVAIPNEFSSPIIATPNKLSNLSTTSYTLSIYMMNASEYKKLITTENYSLPTQQLLIQSAGAPAGKRNKYFDLDFYIEDCQIETVIGTQQVGGSHTIGKIYFKIVEPNGLTLLNRLRAAVKEHTAITSETHELSQHYLLVIRFYGYDEYGNQISGDQLGSQQRTTDPNSITEKFIPFIIGGLNYRIASEGSTYEIEAVGMNTQIAYSQKRGTIPFNMQVQASKVADILNGNLIVAETELDINLGGSAGDFEQDLDIPPGGQVTDLVIQGLTTALNVQQAKMVTAGQIDIADRYVIKISDQEGLSDARLVTVDPPDVSKKLAGTNKDTTAAKYDPSRMSYNAQTRTWNIKAGTQVVQVIDLVMRNSTYITYQQKIQYSQEYTSRKNIQNTKQKDTTLWYRITANCLPIGYDTRRKDYAYEITYTISPYQINTPRTPGFSTAKYRGVHKRYDYWFTGLNKEVLDFNIDVNANYYTVFNKNIDTEVPAQGKFIASNHFAGGVTAGLQGNPNSSAWLAGALASRLYNVADVASTTLKIMGDPDWILQSDFYKNRRVNLNSFLEDGSVNADASEVLFQVSFFPQSDYDIDTGLQEIWSQPGALQGQVVKDAQETLTWAAHTIMSKFSGGSFTNEISGTYRDFVGATNVPLADNALNEAESVTLASTDEAETEIVPNPVSAAAATQSVVPSQTRRLQSNGNTTNYNVPSIDSGQPYRDVMIAGQLTRVFGTESDLLTYYGDLGQPKQGSTVLSDDLGTDIYG